MYEDQAPRLLLSPDTYERHYLTAELSRSLAPKTVLDVGGAKASLAKFLRGTAITTVNVDDSAELQYHRQTLPFPEKSFGVVTATDADPPGAWLVPARSTSS